MKHGARGASFLRRRLTSKGYQEGSLKEIMGRGEPHKGISIIKNGMNKARFMSTMRRDIGLFKGEVTSFTLNIPEYPLIILFVLIGAVLLISSGDLVSMFLAIELQSYGCAPSEACVNYGVFLLTVTLVSSLTRSYYRPRVVASRYANN